VPEDTNQYQEAYYQSASALRQRQVEGKERSRTHLAALGFTEKIKILQKLRDRSLMLSAFGLRRKREGAGWVVGSAVARLHAGMKKATAKQEFTFE
jgi:hypothetical protein